MRSPHPRSGTCGPTLKPWYTHRKALLLADSLADLQKQYDDLTSQFHGFSTPSTANTLTSPNDPTLAGDFAHATSGTSAGDSAVDLTASTRSSTVPAKKTVRFSDAPRDLEAQTGGAPAGELFPYRDDPDSSHEYRDRAQGEDMSNTQIHVFHQQILDEQDAHLDALGASIGRQRELSMQIGDELDSQVLMLDESERITDRHQGRLDRARNQVGRIARGASENKQMTIIVVLIVILVLLIAILK
jgi:syntaxin 8